MFEAVLRSCDSPSAEPPSEWAALPPGFAPLGRRNVKRGNGGGKERRKVVTCGDRALAMSGGGA